MKVQRRGLRGLVRLVLLVSAVVGTTVLLASESQPASAAHTQIYFSYSGFQPAQATNTVILNPGGLPRDLYAWVKNVDDPSGASAFQLNATFDGSLLWVLNFIGYTTWLDDSGRSASCQQAAIEENDAHVQCITIGAVPPYGVQGGGIMGRIRLVPGTTMQNSPLDFSTSFLLNTPPSLEPQPIPVTIAPVTVIFLQCADFNGDGVIDLPNDILGVILRFQMRDVDPGWDPVFDLDDNGVIDLANDILGTILQFGLPCTQPS